MRQGVNVGAYVSGDEEGILKLLSQAGLPTGDLTIDKLKHFLVAKQEDGLVIGAIGVEIYQDIGLLRSLVVDPFYRGNGLGKRLVCELQSLSQRSRIRELFLLATTAADFFKKLGYEVIQRALVPPAITTTEEFRNICPVSATCLFKNLQPS